MTRFIPTGIIKRPALRVTIILRGLEAGKAGYKGSRTLTYAVDKLPGLDEVEADLRRFFEGGGQ